MLINGVEFFTVKEMAEILKIEPSAVKMRLHSAGEKPVAKNALYAEASFEAIRSVPGKGRPKKAGSEGNFPQKLKADFEEDASSRPVLTLDRPPSYGAPSSGSNVIEIPLAGSTAAGRPVSFGDLDADPAVRLWAAPLVKGGGEGYYCVLVKGGSMTEADIKDGDYALLKHAEAAENGEIMLVRHGGSSTLKRIKIARGPNGREDVFMCWEDGSGSVEKLNGEDCEIQGKLIAVERKR